MKECLNCCLEFGITDYQFCPKCGQLVTHKQSNELDEIDKQRAFKAERMRLLNRSLNG